MAGPAEESDRILAEAQRALTTQRAGGRRLQPIGRRSAERRRNHAVAKALRIAVAIAVIAVATIGAGLVLGGIGLGGLFVAVLAGIVAVLVLAKWPRLSVPDIGQLNRGNVRALVGNTELWLERQRPALPAPAVSFVDRIGSQLDLLGTQLEGFGEDRPEGVENRKLVGEQLPEVVSAYTRIPAHLRTEPQGGATPDQRIAESLGKISAEIDSVTRALAAGDIDALAVRTRYLDYKYGDAAPGAEPTG
jgi:hypothetical protein